MGDTQEIYRRFATTPLRLRSKRVLRQPPSSCDESPQRGSDVPTEKEVEVEQLKERIQVECRVDDGPLYEDARMTTPPMRRKSNRGSPKRVSTRGTRSSTAASVQVVEKQQPSQPPVELTVQSGAKALKQKRVTRAVPLVNKNTGGICIDTPTKEYAPPKRSRKAVTRQPTNQDPAQSSLPLSPPPRVVAHVNLLDKENMDLAPLSRNMMDDFADADDIVAETPEEVAKPRRKQPVATAPPPTARRGKRVPSAAVQQLTLEPVRRSRRLRGKPEEPTEQEEAMEQQHALAAVAMYEATQQNAQTAVAPAVVALAPPPPPQVVAVVAQQPLGNVEENFCEPLLATKTTSGALFALWFGAIGIEFGSPHADVNVDELLEVMRCLFAVCMGICQCESVARAHDEPPTDDEAEEPSTTATGSADDEPQPMSTHNKKNAKKKKKSVRFRYFDLSSLNLRYIEDKSAAELVETLLDHYVDDVIAYTAALCEPHHSASRAQLTTQLVGILCDTDKLAIPSNGDNAIATAFRAMDSVDHAEIRASQALFATEFKKLATREPGRGRTSTSPATAAFLEEMFSPLISSLARYLLRLLFLPFNPAGLLDDGEKLRIATYEHQDFGAAIHRAFKEIHGFRLLMAPILKAIAATKKTNTTDKDNAIHKAIRAVDVDDVAHVEQYMLACRFLRLSFGRCILLDSADDEEAIYLRDHLEQLCAMAKRLQMEDEAHLFPLASFEAFVAEQERHEAALTVLEKALASVAMPHYAAEAPCVECNEIVTRLQQPEAITCSSCSGRFHLHCLHLPASFAQYTGSFTCPYCYIGRPR